MQFWFPDAVVEVAMVRLKIKFQNIANTVWALVTVGRASPVLLDTLAEVAHLRLKHFRTQELVNM
eukprot:4355270-Karenia_brevis.AAC.1